MDDSLRDRAIKLEGLIPRVTRTLFRSVIDDPLTDLPVGQMRMMRLLGQKSWTPSSLGEELCLSVSAVTQMANRLDSIGLVQRVEDPTDRRVKHLRLSELGADLMMNRQERRVCLLESTLGRMDEARQRELIQVLEELLDASARPPEPADNSIQMEAEVEQKMPLPPVYAKDKR
ncbi:MAG: MarR family transcriptional regulator [Fimbriimonas sp.]|nr:MarR family transcriptional regulator [Fimbriimonas sp.]